MEEIQIKRRHLPHWTMAGAVFFVTSNIHHGRFTDDEKQLILDHIKLGSELYYDLIAATIMNNHMHILFTLKSNHTLSQVMKGIKGVTARKINKLRKETGTVWLNESYDRIIRDQKEFDTKLEYILGNSVKSGYVEDPYDYRFFYFNEKYPG